MASTMHLTTYALYCIIMVVSWIVEMGDEFEPEFNNLHVEVRNEILARAPVTAIRSAAGASSR
jgi:hypothetical protein